MSLGQSGTPCLLFVAHASGRGARGLCRESGSGLCRGFLTRPPRTRGPSLWWRGAGGFFPAAQRPPAAAQSRQGPSAGCPRTEQARDRGPAGQDSPEVLPPAPLPALAPPPGPGQGLPHTPSQVTTSGTLSPRHLEIQARKGAGPSSGGPSGSPRRLVWEAGRAPRSPCLGREANQGLSR